MRKRGSEEAQKRRSSEGEGRGEKRMVKVGVKTVRLEIGEDVYAKLRNELGLKIVMGNFHGLQDEFMKILVSTIDKGDDSVVITTRKGDEG